ncbi:hypothetical protein ABAC460_13650 [Asticcacaulis sp. AC460]|nr:hypothetical protein ABAC460_13650 [Asticcacaulis sp. AC460]
MKEGTEHSLKQYQLERFAWRISHPEFLVLPLLSLPDEVPD